MHIHGFKALLSLAVAEARSEEPKSEYFEVVRSEARLQMLQQHDPAINGLHGDKK